MELLYFDQENILLTHVTYIWKSVLQYFRDSLILQKASIGCGSEKTSILQLKCASGLSTSFLGEVCKFYLMDSLSTTKSMLKYLRAFHLHCFNPHQRSTIQFKADSSIPHYSLSFNALVSLTELNIYFIYFSVISD